MTPLMTPIFHFHLVVSSLMTPTTIPTPPVVQTSLTIHSTKQIDQYIGDCFQCRQETFYSLEGNGFKFELKVERRRKQSGSSLIEGKDLVAVFARLWEASRVICDRGRG